MMTSAKRPIDMQASEFTRKLYELIINSGAKTTIEVGIITLKFEDDSCVDFTEPKVFIKR